MPPGRLPGEVFRACPTGKRPRGRPRTRWRDYVSRLAWERLGVPPEELEEVSGEREAKLSIYQSIYVPTLTYDHELWVERVRSRIQAAEMSFLRTVAGRSLRDRVRSSITREELGVEPLLLHIERGQLRWLGHLFRMPPERLPGEVFWACPTGKRPRGRRLGVPPEELEEVSGEREVWASLLRLLPPRPGSGLRFVLPFAPSLSFSVSLGISSLLWRSQPEGGMEEGGDGGEERKERRGDGRRGEERGMEKSDDYPSYVWIKAESLTVLTQMDTGIFIKNKKQGITLGMKYPKLFLTFALPHLPLSLYPSPSFLIPRSGSVDDSSLAL
ncbi:hypothetical protein QTP70_005074 [Hemibagrus guttatus]|uniref:Uncharacterized protein n=1 Tax=Hemibagrus guttatus TaxID=175788 RepID=A0AAE0UQT7_9TELE|nr:hypothetical protein QTP70_005074 [Hemibagrus guttatus]